MGTKGIVRMGAVLGLAAVLLLAGCVADTKNIGGPLSSPNGPVPVATFQAEDSWIASQSATLTVTWTGGTPPYTIGANMGGGTTENVPAGTSAESPFVQPFTLIEGMWTYTVTVIDAAGVPGTTTGTYDVQPAPSTVSIDNVYFDGVALIVDVSSSASDDTITVTVTEPPGLTVDATSKVAMQTFGTAIFHWTATDIVAGGSGETTITATNEGGATDTETATITFPDPWYPYDDLLAVPSTASTAIGEEVVVAVLAGDFPPEKRFMYMNGVAVTIERGASYVAGSFNAGAVGGAWDEPDGLWAIMDPQPAGFIGGHLGGGMVPDWLPDTLLLEFSLIPMSGSEVIHGGPLFNFGLTFDQPGTYTLGFLEFQDVKRTFYSDGEFNEYYWSDLSNEHVPNTVTVTE